jgi:hypothetical protein
VRKLLDAGFKKLKINGGRIFRKTIEKNKGGSKRQSLKCSPNSRCSTATRKFTE